MTLNAYSDRCVRLVKRFEGYHRKLDDGRCCAYQEKINGKLDVPTIGWGSVHGVEMGMIWTVEQAEVALRAELDEKCKGVLRLVTVELNQNELDALCSFAFNLGVGALGKSTLLKKLNSGDRAGAANEFAKWGNFKGQPVKGLAARRAAEAALFVEPMPDDVAPSYMPQDADKPGTVTTSQVVAAIAPPAAITTGLTIFEAWQAVGDKVVSGLMWVSTKPITASVIVVSVLTYYLIPKRPT